MDKIENLKDIFCEDYSSKVRKKMTLDEAIRTMRGYPCVCELGSSPFNCNDSECPFGEAIRILVNEVGNQKNVVKKISMADNIINDEERGLI
jgi:hypothetical protein